MNVLTIIWRSKDGVYRVFRLYGARVETDGDQKGTAQCTYEGTEFKLLNHSLLRRFNKATTHFLIKHDLDCVKNAPRELYANVLFRNDSSIVLTATANNVLAALHPGNGTVG